MGRGDSRLTMKMRRRKNQRKLKLRAKRKIEQARAMKASGGSRADDSSDK